MSEPEMRIALETELGGSVSDAQWDYLEMEGFLTEVADGTRTIDELADKVREARQLFGGGGTSQPR